MKNIIASLWIFLFWIICNIALFQFSIPAAKYERSEVHLQIHSEQAQQLLVQSLSI